MAPNVVELDEIRPDPRAGLIDLNPAGAMMAAAQTGDKRAYDQALQLCQSWLKRYLSTRLQPGQIDDVIQETLMAVHRKRHTYDPERPFAPWFVAIARFKWLDRLRAVYKDETAELVDVHGVASHEESVLSRMVLDRVMVQLPEAQATVLKLAKIDGYAIEEISQMTGQSAALVKVNIHRARKKLIKLLEQSHG